MRPGQGVFVRSTSNDVPTAARRKTLEELARRLLAEAASLGADPDEVIEIVGRRRPANGEGPMTDPILKADHLIRYFGDKIAVRGLSLNVEQGRILALLGPNGAGKTTLLRLALGLLEPSAGRIQVLGRNARDLDTATCRRIASVGEGDDPPRWATLRQMMSLHAAAYPRFDRTAAEYLFEQHSLDIAQRFSTLSKGQRRWASCALALASHADLLLLDEPADGLDPAARIRLYEHLRAYVTEHDATVVVTTHILSDIERVADDIAIIDRGHVVLHAGLEDIRETVREIEIPDTRVAPAFGESVRLLGRRLIEETLIAWVVCDGVDDDELRRLTDFRARVRPCSLESVYLAITEYAPDHVDSYFQEVTP